MSPRSNSRLLRRRRACSLSIDALPLLLKGGISNYVRPLAEAMVSSAGKDWRIRLLFRLGVSTDRWKNFFSYASSHKFYRGNLWPIPLPDRFVGNLWESSYYDLMTDNTKGFFLSTTDLVPRMKHRAVVGIWYDLVPLRIPSFFDIDPKAFISAASSRSRRCHFIVAISECTKRDICDLLGYPDGKICVVYPGSETHSHKVRPASFKRPYIIYLGALALNKNVDGMLRIFSRCVIEHRLDMDIVLTGKDFCGRSFWQRIIQDLKIEGRVHMTGWISDADRGNLLAHATMLWQFSWYEGFGLPVLEAANRGVPVLYTNRGAVPEILKNPEQEIDPADEETTASKAAQALRSQETLERWKRLGIARASEFSWKKSAQKLLGWMEDRL
jgi:glycosyltransferase involved in cell wall biosynthesis